MQHIRHLCAGLLFVGFTTFAFAEDVAPTAASEIDTSADPQTAQSSSLKELKNIKAKDLKVDANIPIISMVVRLVSHKGIDLVREVFEEILEILCNFMVRVHDSGKDP